MTNRERRLLHLGAQAVTECVRNQETRHVVAIDLDDPSHPDIRGAGLCVHKPHHVRDEHRILLTVQWDGERAVLDYLAD